MPRAQYWVFTLNNYTEEEESLLSTLVSDENNCIAYLAYGREIAPSTGTPHLQGHLELRSRLREDQLNRLLGNRARLAVRGGTFEENEEYCSKCEDYHSWGERVSVGRGKRSDLASLQESLQSNRSLTQISNDHFGAFMRYRRSIVSYINLHSIPRTWKMSVIVYYGPTGTGKTSSVYDNAVAITDIWPYPGNGWFDGYSGEKIALFDEFTGSEFKLSYLLKLLDCYPMRVPIKGDYVNWAPEEIYITSNMHPNDWYPNALSEHVLALRRRITNVVNFGNL